jgi:uncharacterized heparinase superfamily protein
MEWAWSLYQADDIQWARATFAELWESWRSSNPVGDKDAWSPYVASLRLWVLCAVFDRLVKSAATETDVTEQISWHAGYVRAHLELDVGGNHLIKNLKSLVGAGVFLGRSDLVDFARTRMETQVGIQVLADGGHYERSPSYHCQVLEDLIDVETLLQAARYRPSAQLAHDIEAMRRWLGAMIGDDGEVAMFNDATPVGARRIAALTPAAPPMGPLIALGASGYVVLRPDSRTQVICDVGDPCPPDLPAHAHADCLSFEMWLDGTKTVVDTATSTYEPGPQRDYERSTAAHSTVQVDGEDQTEVWGAFRAARLARATLENVAIEGTSIVVVASHDGYRRLPGSPLHRRRWLAAPGSLAVSDIIAGKESHHLRSNLYVSKDHRLSLIDSHGGELSVKDCEVADGFGKSRAARLYLLEAPQVTLPATMSWRLEW